MNKEEAAVPLFIFDLTPQLLSKFCKLDIESTYCHQSSLLSCPTPNSSCLLSGEYAGESERVVVIFIQRNQN